jgi:hypothetical protein
MLFMIFIVENKSVSVYSRLRSNNGCSPKMQLCHHANEAFQSIVFVARRQRFHAGVIAATVNDIYWQICRQQKR